MELYRPHPEKKGPGTGIISISAFCSVCSVAIGGFRMSRLHMGTHAEPCILVQLHEEESLVVVSAPEGGQSSPRTGRAESLRTGGYEALLQGGKSEADEWSRFQRPGEQSRDGHRSVWLSRSTQECKNQLVTHFRD